MFRKCNKSYFSPDPEILTSFQLDSVLETSQSVLAGFGSGATASMGAGPISQGSGDVADFT